MAIIGGTDSCKDPRITVKVIARPYKGAPTVYRIQLNIATVIKGSKLLRFECFLLSNKTTKCRHDVECKLEDNKSTEAQTGTPRIRRVVWHFPVTGEMGKMGKWEIKDCRPHGVPPFAITLFSPFRALMSGGKPVTRQYKSCNILQHAVP
ncbi:uncharacterized protein LOC6525256 [Drosophila yakuba]|uniref:uncharacterized protein LOC6525256 n=1 Tax=Drosophila yakuba TaxID=7245 RepID=UPI00193080FD|nr:uncharacterized protein LOC6525256 [Drosophila yakuba]